MEPQFSMACFYSKRGLFVLFRKTAQNSYLFNHEGLSTFVPLNLLSYRDACGLSPFYSPFSNKPSPLQIRLASTTVRTCPSAWRSFLPTLTLHLKFAPTRQPTGASSPNRPSLRQKKQVRANSGMSLCFVFLTFMFRIGIGNCCLQLF